MESSVIDTVINASDNVNSLEPSEDELKLFYSQCHWQGEEGGESWEQQREVEQNVFLLRKKRVKLGYIDGLTLYRARHVAFLMRSLDYLPYGYESLSAARPWVMFWILHALDLLGAPLPEEYGERVVAHLEQCWDAKGGGFGGGPGQVAQMASTYAAVFALCTVGTERAYAAISVEALHGFMRKMKLEDGSFRVESMGEADVRAVYSALAVASITGILRRDPELFEGCAEYVASLQAFDGGFGGEPGNEAHGGNTYCGTAALVALGRLKDADTDALLDWAAMRQMSFEGGFQGRTNKLVDSCYSFWVGSLFPLLQFSDAAYPYHPVRSDNEACVSVRAREMSTLFDGASLQRYVLECSQMRKGGFCDKPSTPADLLHTCYALSGLSVAQEYGGALAPDKALVRRTDPVFNISVERAVEARLHFEKAAATTHLKDATTASLKFS